ncbi:MAG: hypothetical protein IPK28_20095 [Devosia sp.]|nr:hypothetical protein [Devosia sp.]
MGKLVHFTKRGRSADGKGTAHEGAEIVLFTGVRYERSGSAPELPTKPVGATSRAKRRRG